MNNRNLNILLLLIGMHNTRLIQCNINTSNREIYHETNELQWDDLLFELYVSVLEELTNT